MTRKPRHKASPLKQRREQSNPNNVSRPLPRRTHHGRDHDNHQDSHFQEEGFQQGHQEEVEDSQAVEVHLEEDFPMWDQKEEETPDKGQTSWQEIHLKCSQEYEQKLSTSSLNGSFMSALTSPT